MWRKAIISFLAAVLFLAIPYFLPEAEVLQPDPQIAQQEQAPKSSIQTDPVPGDIISQPESFVIHAAPAEALVPLRIEIPSIGLAAPIQPVSLTEEGIVDTPEFDVGWYQNGKKPGETGNAVLNGHFSQSDFSSGVFHDISALAEGDEILTTDIDSRLYAFRVVRVDRMRVADFPVHEVYGPADHANLILVTCAGSYSRTRKDYAERTVVYARLAE